MALGVLNNLSAIYAATNLNHTNSSLQTVLQQLSSGSRINSGADDAAGLSLVNGLAANSAALTQSTTNATEGVGLLQVADGALSQVSTLLNRAITLATEASNGTLNTSQEAAANQEYQSILSEINNIGSTTTYNQVQVFSGSQAGVSIYTGDSSSTGASLDVLYFAKLTSSSVGDSGGVVVQSSAGQFVDFSADTAGTLTTAAGLGDTIDSTALAFTITNADGTTSSVATTATGITITAADGTTTTVAGDTTTLGGLIATINSAAIPGVTATFTTAGAVGDSSVDSNDTGILLSNTNANVTISGLATVSATDTTSGGTGSVYANNKAITTISYQTASTGDKSADLSATDLLSATDAQSALSTLNDAITYVAAQDGYLGAQINTLNSISSVMSAQSENIVSAQNAIQATDYASATSALSKYEVLSQTGIAALAQANSVQQEVTKLLQ